MLSQFFELREKEIEREKSVDTQHRNEVSVTLQRWRGTKRFFTGERGAWSSRWVSLEHIILIHLATYCMHVC